MRVLALDDDKAVLKAVKTILTLSGHEVDCVDNAVDAVRMIKARRYDIVLFDYKMDGHDGVWFLENVTLGSSTKAILMTGYGNRNLVNTVFGRGASGYLMKPFTADELLKHIEFHGATLTADVLPPDKMAEKTAISAGDT
ncbi:MAG: hypothetical protein A2283_08615 [Lentisphaerae bacterium RIFOXYA12_FULL_48_11]|nr:MAG: hypothetical protein A2283_08615 [Lentisphaerae bacterium RIFOXYA12_FULL_48_11]